MLNFFKRTKLASWEKDLILNILTHLPNEYLVYKTQVNDGLISGIKETGNKNNYVAFLFNKEVVGKYDNKAGSSFRITGVKVFDVKSNEFIDIYLYFSRSLISGYALPGAKKPRLDLSRIEYKGMRREALDDYDFKKISKILSVAEQKLLNPGDVYEVDLNGKIYYHIIDTEDGDFIAIDEGKKIYKVRHDPFEISLIEKELAEVLNS